MTGRLYEHSTSKQIVLGPWWTQFCLQVWGGWLTCFICHVSGRAGVRGRLLGKAVSCTVFWPTLGFTGRGLGSGILPYQVIRVFMDCAGFITLCGNITPVLDSVCLLLFCLSVCIIWHLANPTIKSVPWEDRIGSLVLWHKSGACRATALCWLLDHGGLTLLKLILLCLSLLHMSKALFHPMLDCVVSSSVISMQWAKNLNFYF